MTSAAPALTRRQRQIYEHLLARQAAGDPAPSLEELCDALGLRSRGSMHLQVKALVDEGLVEPMNGRQRGVRVRDAVENRPAQLPLLGTIAAGRPIEAVAVPESVEVPAHLCGGGACYVLKVRGDSMIEDGILDGDMVVVERRDHARDGEIVVALIDGQDATLKRILQRPGEVTLLPANAAMEPIVIEPQRVQIQGVVVGQMRSYRN
jgi:repressor LexA